MQPIGLRGRSPQFAIVITALALVLGAAYWRSLSVERPAVRASADLWQRLGACRAAYRYVASAPADRSQ